MASKLLKAVEQYNGLKYTQGALTAYCTKEQDQYVVSIWGSAGLLASGQYTRATDAVTACRRIAPLTHWRYLK